MQAEMVDKVDGRVLCGPSGQPVAVSAMDFVERLKGNTGEKTVLLQISGVATDYLVNPNNPLEGSETLPEPVPVVIEADLEKEDQAIFLRQLSQALDLGPNETLVDDGDWIQNVVEGSAVHTKLREKGVYAKAARKTDWEKACRYGSPPWFFNLHVMPKRSAATKEALAGIRERLQAKKAAAEKAKADAEAVFG